MISLINNDYFWWEKKTSKKPADISSSEHLPA